MGTTALLPTNLTTNLSQCLQDLQQGLFGLEGALDAHGNPTSNVSQVAGFTYRACTNACGTNSAPFDTTFFIQQFLAWLIPWFALISQLPYGANDVLKNFEAMVLMVGSPMLATFSLALAVTSSRWMVERFRRSNHHRQFLAATLMNNLQRVSFRLPTEDHVLPSLVVLQENDIWWQRVTRRLDHTEPRWTLAAIMSMVYVALAYVLTWVDTISSRNASPLNGQFLGSNWLSLLPVVICNLQFTSRADGNQISRALRYANTSFFVATESDKPDRSHSPQPITIEPVPRNAVDEDRVSSAPFFFYARIFMWLRATIRISDCFDAASQHAFDDPHGGDVFPRNKKQIVEYCTLRHDGYPGNIFNYDVANIFVKSTLLALFLQMGTVGVTFIGLYLSAPRGLGCYSGSQLLYALLSTLVWLFCTISSILADASLGRRSRHRNLLGGLSIALRLLAKVLALLNIIWLLTSTFLQFSNSYYSCYCASSALGLGSRAYISFLAPGEISILGIGISSLTALLFIIAFNIIAKRPEHPQSGDGVEDTFSQ